MMTPISIARERSLYEAFAERAIQTRQRDLGRIQLQISTGLRVNRPSDDPLAFAQARQMEALGDRYGQYQRTISASSAWVDATQAALDGLSELLTQAYEEGVGANDDTLSEEDREAVAVELESKMEELLDSLNTSFGGEYLFGGTASTTKPFTEAAGVVTYNGNTGGRTRLIGQDVRIDINIDGERLHVYDGGSGATLTDAMQGLIDAVRSGDSVLMEEALAGVTAAKDHVVGLASEAGSVANRLEIADGQLATAINLAEGRRSDYEDVDLAEALTEFEKAELGLQATLSVMSKSIEMTLLDYLR